MICGREATEVHHIIERKLFPDGGYYLANAASLDNECHWQAELTLLSCGELRAAAGIGTVILPPGFDASKEYDKWGNVILPDGTRETGPMFDTEQVQKVLRRAGLLHLFY